MKKYHSKSVKDIIADKMIIETTFDTEFGIGYEITAAPYIGKVIFEITFNDGNKQELRNYAKARIDAMLIDAKRNPFDNFNISQKYIDMNTET